MTSSQEESKGQKWLERKWKFEQLYNKEKEQICVGPQSSEIQE